jgi:endoplasmic reticulum junction formation protein lunapark
VFPVMYVYALINADESVLGTRKVAKWWYTRSIDRETQEKEALKKRLDDKIEELKEKSDYYTTQQLLERYDSKSVSKGTSQDKFRDPSQLNLHQKYPPDNPRHQQSFETTLHQRGTSKSPVPPLPPPITPSTFAPPQSQPLSQNIPQFHPSAFSPPPSPTLPQQPHSKTFLDKLLDLIVGEDENAPDHRYALICRHCRAHNGLAPPGERGDDVGYLCGRCGGWNGPEPNKQQGQGSSTQQSNSNNGSKSEERAETVVADGEQNKGLATQETQYGVIGEMPQE